MFDPNQPSTRRKNRRLPPMTFHAPHIGPRERLWNRERTACGRPWTSRISVVSPEGLLVRSGPFDCKQCTRALRRAFES